MKKYNTIELEKIIFQGDKNGKKKIQLIRYLLFRKFRPKLCFLRL